MESGPKRTTDPPGSRQHPGRFPTEKNHQNLSFDSGSHQGPCRLGVPTRSASVGAPHLGPLQSSFRASFQPGWSLELEAVRGKGILIRVCRSGKARCTSTAEAWWLAPGTKPNVSHFHMSVLCDLAKQGAEWLDHGTDGTEGSLRQVSECANPLLPLLRDSPNVTLGLGSAYAGHLNYTAAGLLPHGESGTCVLTSPGFLASRHGMPEHTRPRKPSPSRGVTSGASIGPLPISSISPWHRLVSWPDRGLAQSLKEFDPVGSLVLNPGAPSLTPLRFSSRSVGTISVIFERRVFQCSTEDPRIGVFEDGLPTLQSQPG